MTTFPAATPGGALPDKQPGVHRWIAVASYTVSPEEAAAATMGETVLLDQAHLFSTPEIGCLDCEERYDKAWTTPCPAGDEWPSEPGGVLSVADLSDDDHAAILAGVDLIGRSGATDFEIGYLDDNPANPRWWAKAQYQGARLSVEDFTSPVTALDALVRRVLSGGLCTHCGKRVKIGGSGGKACRWYREGETWHRGCEATHP